MKNVIKKSACLFLVLLVLCSCVPFYAFADPVSAGIMANAFAQAIAAYGASNGVAMTFDVTNSSGIGESVHELWETFRSGQQQADDYATLAAALFPDLYYKSAVALGTASDVYAVGMHIDSTYAEEFDNFYNWLLSGPAEMVQVDNQYYQFSSAQIGASALPIEVVSINGFSWPLAPTYPSGSSFETLWNVGLQPAVFSSGPYRVTKSSVNPYDVYVCGLVGTGMTMLISYGNGKTMYVFPWNNDYTGGDYYWLYDSDYQFYYATYDGGSTISEWLIPSFNGADTDEKIASAKAAFAGEYANPPVDTVGVKAYSTSGIADIPDTADPNYDALNRAKDIPLNIPWDDSLYGDGTGTLTDAHTGAIAQTIDGDLVQDGIIELAGTTTADPGGGGEDQPSDDPDDYLAVGLEDIFPFCIPFDIYNFLSALAAEPVAPHFTATLAFPQAVGGNQTIDLNFDSPTWNQLAQLLRLLELLAFIVGLALLTRSMFIRG